MNNKSYKVIAFFGAQRTYKSCSVLLCLVFIFLHVYVLLVGSRLDEELQHPSNKKLSLRHRKHISNKKSGGNVAKKRKVCGLLRVKEDWKLRIKFSISHTINVPKWHEKSRPSWILKSNFYVCALYALKFHTEVLSLIMNYKNLWLVQIS